MKKTCSPTLAHTQEIPLQCSSNDVEDNEIQKKKRKHTHTQSVKVRCSTTIKNILGRYSIENTVCASTIRES